MNQKLNMAAMCFLPALLLLFTVQCNKENVASRWANGSITIDGKVAEWDSVLAYNEKLDASYGIQNDGDFLYVTFVTANPALQRQLLMSGLVLWLDEQGDKARDIGFKFPIGLMERKLPARELFAAFRDQGENNDARIHYLLNQLFRDLQILGAKGQNLGIFAHHEAKDQKIQFALTYERGNLAYELCLPLHGSGRQPWSIASAAQIGLGFETPEFDRSQMGGMRPGGMGMMDASTGGGGMRGGGRGGGGMRGGGRTGGMSGAGAKGGGFSPAKPLKMWMTVSLAAK